MSVEQKSKFHDFVLWFEKYKPHREIEDSQIFITKLIEAFGNQGIKEIGGIFEKSTKLRDGKRGRIDFIYPTRMIIEMKSSGESLNRHYDQLFEYWISLTPNRPPYAVLCNFDEIWIFDLNIQLNDPVHKLKIQDLAKNWGPLNFLFPTPKTPIFDNNNVEVTKKTAAIMGEFFMSLRNRGMPQLSAQRLTLQLVVALFSQDIGLIPKYTIQTILKNALKEECSPESLFELLSAMATDNRKKKSKQFKEIPYFNGGLFDDVDVIALDVGELYCIYNASKENWECVRPSIFGAIFESSMNQKDRHAKGAHFTSEFDIQKIIYPTIIRPFKEKIAKVLKNKKKVLENLKSILKELSDFKVLDPACGSGNFLYIAYRELIRLEMNLQEIIREKSGVTRKERFDSENANFSRINTKNFYGLDINSFGVELTKVALSIGRQLAKDEFNLLDEVLPFHNLDKNIICADALFTKWPDVDVIIGNPPFLGTRAMRKELGADYIEKVRNHFKNTPAKIDFCSYWFRLAHDSTAKRMGLVATNSISQGITRGATLDYILSKGGYIHDVLSSQVWSGEANVYVSIVNWMRKKPSQYILDGKKVEAINSSLKSTLDIIQAKKIKENLNRSFKGCEVAGKGFVISKKKAHEWIKKDVKNQEILKPMIDGSSLVNPNSMLNWIIDFFDMPLEKASFYELPFERVKNMIRPIRKNNLRKQKREYWWQFGEKQPKMRKALKGLKHYFALAQTSKYISFRTIDINILPCEAVIVVASDDFFILGILNSKLHRDWVKAQCSTLGRTIRYTHTTCFETFPFPQNVSESGKQKIRDVMTELENLRNAECIKRKISLTGFYNEFINEPTSKLYQLHQELDRLVCEVYGWKYIENKNYNEELFYLNQEITA